MQRRSTLGTHFGTELVAMVESSHGVRLTGGSTGGVVEAFGDDTSIACWFRGKGAGLTRLGSSGSTGSAVRIAGSTTGLEGIERYLVQFTPPDLSSFANADSTFTVTGATTNASYVFTERLAINSTGYIVTDVRCSTANEVTMRFTNVSGSTQSGSTNRGTLLQFRY